MGKGAQRSTQNTSQSQSGSQTSTNNLSPFAQQQAQRLFGMGAGPNDLQQRAYQGLGSLASPDYGDARAAFSAAQGSTLTPDKLQPWLDASSPYTKQVTDATRAAFDQQNAQQANQLMGQLAGSGGFGNDRSAVLAATLGGQQQLAQAPVLAQLQQGGYDRALSAAGDAAKLSASTNLASGYGLGSLDTQQQQALLQQLQAQMAGGNNQIAQQLGISQGLAGLGGIAGGSSTSQGTSTGQSEMTQPGPSWLSQLGGLGALLGGSGAFGGKDGSQGWLGQAWGGLKSFSPFGKASGGAIPLASGGSAPNHPAVEKFGHIVRGMRELRDGETRGFADGGTPSGTGDWPWVAEGAPTGLGWIKNLIPGGTPAADMGFSGSIDPVTGSYLAPPSSGKIQGRVESTPKVIKSVSDFTPSTTDTSQDGYTGKPPKVGLAALDGKVDPDTVDFPDMKPEKRSGSGEKKASEAGLGALAHSSRDYPGIVAAARETAGTEAPASPAAPAPPSEGGLMAALNPKNWNMPLVGLGLGLLTNTTRAGTGEAARSGMQMGLQAHAAEQNAALQAAKLQEEIRQHKADLELRGRQVTQTGLPGEMAPVYPSAPPTDAEKAAAQERALGYEAKRDKIKAETNRQATLDSKQIDAVLQGGQAAQGVIDRLDRMDALAGEIKPYLGPGERFGLNSTAAYFKDPKAYAKLEVLKSELNALVKDEAAASYLGRGNVTNGKIRLEQLAKASENMPYDALKERLQSLKREAQVAVERQRTLQQEGGLAKLRDPNYNAFAELDKRNGAAKPAASAAGPVDLKSLPPAAKDTPIGAMALSKDGKPVRRVQGGWEPVAVGG